MSSNVWFVTGASRGLGRAIVENALNSGHRVMATARDTAPLADLAAQFPHQLRTWGLDVTSKSDVEAAIDATQLAFGRLDIVVNNAATASMAPIETMTAEDLNHQMDVVFFGTVNVTQAAIPTFRAQRSGHFIQVTSISTRRTVPGLAGYISAKWAVAGFSHVAALELAPFNVRVTMVETGGLRTSMVNQEKVRTYGHAYDATVGKEARRFLDRSGAEPIDPTQVAQVLEHVTTLEDPPLRLVLGKDAVELVRHLNEQQPAVDARWAHLGQMVDYD